MGGASGVGGGLSAAGAAPSFKSTLTSERMDAMVRGWTQPPESLLGNANPIYPDMQAASNPPMSNWEAFKASVGQSNTPMAQDLTSGPWGFASMEEIYTPEALEELAGRALDELRGARPQWTPEQTVEIANAMDLSGVSPEMAEQYAAALFGLDTQRPGDSDLGPYPSITRLNQLVSGMDLQQGDKGLGDVCSMTMGIMMTQGAAVAEQFADRCLTRLTSSTPADRDSSLISDDTLQALGLTAATPGGAAAIGAASAVAVATGSSALVTAEALIPGASVFIPIAIALGLFD